MGNEIKTYSMLLGRPWLKQAKEIRIRVIEAPPNSLIDSTASPKVKTVKGKRIRVCSLTRGTLGVKGHAGALG
jgi:hypothetical protein